MKILEPILKKHLSNIPSSKRFFDLINNYISEVKTLTPISKNTNLVVGKILNFQKVPNSKKLNLVTVDLGKKIVKIVCGANNLAKNRKVIVSSQGSFLAGLNSILQNKTICGIFSEGMICALDELGFDPSILTEEEKAGIFLFEDPDDRIPLGSDALIPLGMDGFILELGVTPNRADLLSYFGFAKDLKAVLKSNPCYQDDQTKVFEEPQTKKFFNSLLTLPKVCFSVVIESKACYEYNACMLENIKIKPSPLWLRNTLLQSDIKPINNVVDITNLILLKYGIPLHAFDSQKIKEIKVRQAFNQEIITTLNQNVFQLDQNDLVITDGIKPIALAGIVGLLESGIKENTQKIILEAAYFLPVTIAKTSQKLKIKTQSSLRFERGIDPDLIPLALMHACDLLVSLADAKITSQPIRQKKQVLKPKVLDLNLAFVKSKTGIAFSLTQTQNWLSNLDYQVLSTKSDNLKLSAPLRRYDIKIKENVVADLVRLYGYHNVINIKTTKSPQAQMTLKQKNIRELKKILVNLGFYETVTYSLISAEMFEAFSYQKERIKITNPLSQDKVILRQSLLSSLVEVLSQQHKRQAFDNAFFEISKVYYLQEEILSLGLALSGKFLNSGWLKQDVNNSFFVLKGLIEKISTFLGIQLTFQKSTDNSNLHPGIQAKILYNNQVIGMIGKTHPLLNEKHHLKDSFLCEFLLLNDFLAQKNQVLYQPISKFPVITRDLSFLIEKKYHFFDIIQTIKSNLSFDLVDCQLFDVYQTNEEQQLSLALRFTFSNPYKNLQNAEIDKNLAQIITTLIQNYQITIR
ncbi:phenylalanine--tRNA ligase subunit beta [Candidatus Phytoplasma solani]|uniref:phenylalanine--tRNA ligase subunit beta n=1 Tax=Candidatus Phytoplasma solani TaxID=69896 RepID=UPI00358E63E2